MASELTSYQKLIIILEVPVGATVNPAFLFGFCFTAFTISYKVVQSIGSSTQ